MTEHKQVDGDNKEQLSLMITISHVWQMLDGIIPAIAPEAENHSWSFSWSGAHGYTVHYVANKHHPIHPPSPKKKGSLGQVTTKCQQPSEK